MESQRPLKTVTKFILANSLIAIVGMSLFALFSLVRFQTQEVKEANADLERCMRYSWELLRQKGEHFRIVDGRLLADSYVVNGNFEVPDKVQGIFGGVATVFMGDTRVSTNVQKADGSRAVGTKLVGPAYDAIFKEGKPYRGEAPILGIPYLTAYDPIRNDDGQIIGVLFVGVKKSEFLARFSGMKTQLLLALLGLITVVAAQMILLARQTRKYEKKQEDHLRFLKTLIDTMPNPLFYKDTDGKYLGCNNAFEEFTGIPMAKLVGKSVFDIAQPHLADLYHKVDMELFREQGVLVYETSMAYADGTMHDVIFSKATFPGPDGTTGGIIGTIHDITDRKRAEATIEAQKDFAENLVLNCTVPTFVLDRNHRVIIWNRACEQLTGVEAAEVLGTLDPWKAFYDEQRPLLADFVIAGNLDDLSRYYESFGKSTVLPEGHQAEAWFPNLKGSRHYLTFSAAPIRSQAGEVVAAIQTLEDITERKLAEEECLHALSLLSATLEATADGILVTDLAGTIQIYNQQFADMWGIPQHILAEKNDHLTLSFVLDQLKNPAQYHAAVAAQYECPERETFDVCEFVDGRIFERHSKPQREGGKAVGRVRSFRDVTEKRKLEQQLRHSQKMEAMGTLAGGIAHDFNNILTAITGYCSLIAMHTNDGDPVQDYLAKLVASTERAAALTRSLLAYSRKQPLSLQSIDLNTVVTKIWHLLSRLLGEDIDLSSCLDNLPLNVLADNLQLEQVLMNLATNARDAMPYGGSLRIVTARLIIDDEFISAHGFGVPGRYAVITVEDTGSGMDEPTRERIFEPFFTTKEVGKGTGLGLSIAFGIIEQHNGYIDVSSRPGEGTSFTIYLPLTDMPHQEPSLSTISRPSSGHETVLLVEDDRDIRSILKEVLESEGYAVIEAMDGEEGKDRFDRHGDDIDLVLLDVVMPKMSGSALYDEIAARRPDVKTLFMSGYTADLLNAKGVLGESMYFIPKPIAPDQLLASIREALDS